MAVYIVWVLRLYPPYHVCFQTGRKPHRKRHRCARWFSMQVRVSWDSYVPSQCPPPCVKAPHRGKRGVLEDHKTTYFIKKINLYSKVGAPHSLASSLAFEHRSLPSPLLSSVTHAPYYPPCVILPPPLHIHLTSSSPLHCLISLQRFISHARATAALCRTHHGRARQRGL